MTVQTIDKAEKKIFVWEPWFFMAFGLFHLHRIWGLLDRNSYAGFWLGVLENKGLFYFVLIWLFFVLLGGFVFVLGIKLLIQRSISYS